jgi:tRNA (guanine-N7-)-methyltransferase
MALRDNIITEPIQIKIPDEAGMLDFAQMFENKNPVELEIGSGKGTFLLAIAQAKPGVNFIGFEWAKEYAEYAADRLRRHNLLNTRIVNGEATWWIRIHVPNASIDNLHIYFPDPWPKTRHHKRRLIQLPFIKEAHRILKPGGVMRLVTDHADYFAWMQDVLKNQDLLDVIPFESPVPLKPDAPAGSIVGTNFERKYIAEGRTFNATAARKRSGS